VEAAPRGWAEPRRHPASRGCWCSLPAEEVLEDLVRSLVPEALPVPLALVRPTAVADPGRRPQAAPLASRPGVRARSASAAPEATAGPISQVVAVAVAAAITVAVAVVAAAAAVVVAVRVLWWGARRVCRRR
jgi:hypothetical protein